MTDPVYADESVTVYGGDCIDTLRDLPDASVDAVVTDPPYGLGFMGHEWDQPGVVLDGPREGVPSSQRRRANPAPSGFDAEGAGAKEAGRYDLSRTANQAYGDWCERWATECLRVLKPGGHLLAFGGSRTWHRLACAVEDAGFEMRDSIAWLTGSGFPKSLDVSKAIDKAAGATREVVGPSASHGLAMKPGASTYVDGMGPHRSTGTAPDITAPATPDAQTWQGWGTALKPAHEPIVVARKPLAGTVAANVLAHGTGALNIDGCRVPMTAADRAETEAKNRHEDWGSMPANEVYGTYSQPIKSYDGAAGRWPTNLLLSHGEACVLRGQKVVRTDGHTPAARGPGGVSTNGHGGQDDVTGSYSGDELIEDWDCQEGCPVGQLGKDARFFPTFRYQAKAPGHERPGSTDVDGVRVAHPTVKPLDLMRWLVRLVTPPGGLVLDPFLGSGTTAEAAVVEGMRCVGVERHAPYHDLIRARLSKPIATVLW